jgi:hypothetical protein
MREAKECKKKKKRDSNNNHIQNKQANEREQDKNTQYCLSSSVQ